MAKLFGKSGENGRLEPAAAGTTLTSSVTQSLRAAILNGDIAPGAKLQLEELRDRFQVSLSPVREALTKLAAEGLVVGYENRGFRVAEVSKDNIAEITTLRCHLEGIALEAAIERGDDAWEAGLVGVFHRLTKLEQSKVVGDQQMQAWEDAHGEFHIGLISACGMPLLLQFCEILLVKNNRYRRLFLRDNPPPRNAPLEHKRILDAVLARDLPRAKKLLQAHISSTGANIQAAMPENLSVSGLKTPKGKPLAKAG